MLYKNKIGKEKEIIEIMIRLYCRKRLGLQTVPPEYEELLRYAHRRLSCCKFGNAKPACRKCPIHCYAPKHRERIREVMRWCGPRMLFYHPLITLRHYLF